MKSLKVIIVCCLAFSVLFYAGIQKATAGATFTVSPTGVDDTVNIRNALNMAIAAGPNSTVRLEEGMFFVSSSIQITDFDGTFTGTGEPQVDVVHDENNRITEVTRLSGTVIQTLGDPFPLVGPPWGAWNMVFSFNMINRGGSPGDAPSITIQDMAVVLTAPSYLIAFIEGFFSREIVAFWVGGRYTLDPPGPSERPFPYIELGYGRNAGDTCYCNVEFNQVKVTGQMEPHPDGDNVFSAIPFAFQAWVTDYGMDLEENKASMDCAWQRLTGKMEVKNCEINAFKWGIGLWEIEGSEIEVKDCEAENSYGPAVLLGYNAKRPSNCKLEVSQLKAQGPAAVFFGPSDARLRSTVVRRKTPYIMGLL